MTARRRYVYQPPPEAEQAWQLAVHKARRDDAADLIALLEASDDPKLRDVAWLLQLWRDDRRLPRPAHRPHGSRSSEHRFQIECAAYLVQVGKRYYSGRRRVAEAVTDALVSKAMALVGLADDAASKTKSAVLKAHEQKPRHDVIERVNDDCREWKETMIDYAKELRRERAR